MYGGLNCAAIKCRKGVDDKDNLLDRMGTEELAANKFRMTQARARINDRAKTEGQAIAIHEEVGRVVREAIVEIGGTMPEDLAPKRISRSYKNA